MKCNSKTVVKCLSHSTKKFESSSMHEKIIQRTFECMITLLLVDDKKYFRWQNVSNILSTYIKTNCNWSTLGEFQSRFHSKATFRFFLPPEKVKFRVQKNLLQALGNIVSHFILPNGSKLWRNSLKFPAGKIIFARVFSLFMFRINFQLGFRDLSFYQNWIFFCYS
jgi:hypothetical protein